MYRFFILFHLLGYLWAVKSSQQTLVKAKKLGGGLTARKILIGED
ncbi:hypothetical protein EMIT079MI2_10224 [Bacillus sp. IT-79MI2]